MSPESIADGVIRVLEDPSLRDRIARAGREIVATSADFDRDVDRVEEKYYELLATARRNRPGFLGWARIIVEMMRYLATRERGGA
jgi:hypothetical protein